jgi:hypothetical protein
MRRIWRQPPAGIGGARRDRTDDLMLAKHALSQLSYGPDVGPGPRRPAADAIGEDAQLEKGPTRGPPGRAADWWARVDSNYRPHAYQACALTT